jgi:hypothetical protein
LSLDCLVEGWPLEAICLHLEALTFGDIPSNRLLINVPPGFTKSLLVGVFWPAWERAHATCLSELRRSTFSLRQRAGRGPRSRLPSARNRKC